MYMYVKCYLKYMQYQILHKTNMYNIYKINIRSYISNIL